MKKKILSVVLMLVMLLSVCCIFTGCLEDTDASRQDNRNTLKNADNLQAAQPTPTDIEYSLERYNLIRRAYWVNGQREKAASLPCEITRPLGYVVLFSGNTVVGRFTVDGKVSSLNSYLTPESIYPGSTSCEWLADVDGSYGANDNGIFFFTIDGKYIEWTGTYLYSDIPFEVVDPVLKIGISEVQPNE